MGEIADSMIEGESCSLCGVPFGESASYPCVCPDCWNSLTPSDRGVHLLHPGAIEPEPPQPGQFATSAKLASGAGMSLRKCTEFHYQLRGPDGWILNIYPSTRKLHTDPKHPGPRVRVVQSWSLLDVVKAAIEATAGAKA